MTTTERTSAIGGYAVAASDGVNKNQPNREG
jgi:hypothetical protein